MDESIFAQLVDHEGHPVDVPVGDLNDLLSTASPDWGRCNVLGCQAPPAYSVTVGNDQFALPCCTEHIPALLTPAAEHRVYRLPVEV